MKAFQNYIELLAFTSDSIIMGAKPCKLCCGCVRDSKENIPASISGGIHRPGREPLSRRSFGYGSDRRREPGLNVQYSKIPNADSDDLSFSLQDSDMAPVVESEDFDMEEIEVRLGGV